MSGSSSVSNKVLFIAPSAHLLGGVAVWLDYMLAGLKEKGWQVTLGLTSGTFHDAQLYQQRYPYDDVSLIDNPTKTRYGRVNAIKNTILVVNPNIVMVVNIADAYDACAELKQTVMPDLCVAMTLHGLQSDFICDIQKHETTLDAVIVTNRLTEEVVVHNTSLPADRVFYAPYGVSYHPNKSFSKQSNLDNKLQSGVSNKLEKVINTLYAGRINNEQKRCADIVEIITALERHQRPYVLHVAGDGPSRKTLLSQLKIHGKSGEVIYLGNLNPSDMTDQAYFSSDILLLTSSWETGPIVAWEAMANGVAVVSSRYRGHEEEGALKHEQNALLFNIGDAKSAASYLLRLAKDESLLQSLINNGRELVQQRYTRKQSIDTLYDVITQIMNYTVVPVSQQCDTDLCHWPKNGRFEKMFGHKIADALRVGLGKPAKIYNAGDEWPHSYSSNKESLLLTE